MSQLQQTMVADTSARPSGALTRKRRRRGSIGAVIPSLCGAPNKVTPQAVTRVEMLRIITFAVDVSCMIVSCSRCRSSRRNTCRRRRWSCTTIDRYSKVEGQKLKSQRSATSLLMLCLGLYSSSFMKNVCAETSVDSSLKAFGSGRKLDSSNGKLYTNHFAERKAEKNDADPVDDDGDDDLLGDLLSDYDHSLDISSGDDTAAENSNLGPTPSNWKNPRLKMQSQNNADNPKDSNIDNSGKDKDSVIILSAVDGTLAGISRASGRLLWKQSKDSAIRGRPGEVGSPPIEWSQFLSPLVSTTTKALKSTEHNNIHNYQWHAVPSIDGTVYLTGGGDSNAGDGSTGHELSVSTHIRDLVDRAPFVDAQQRFFVGSRKAMVAAIDERTGKILRVIPKWNQGEDADDGQLPPSLEGRDVVWIGRLEHTVTVHDLHKGTVDIEFSVAEILSVDEMIHGDRQQRVTAPSSLVIRDEGGETSKKDGATQEDEENERLFTDYITEALRHPKSGNRILSLPAPDEPDQKKVPPSARGGSSISQGSPFFVSTPSGNVAFRDHCRLSESFTAGWVSFALLESPVVYAIEASSGRKIRVNMLDDSSVSSSESNKDGLPQLLEKQIALIEQSSSLPVGMIDEACRLSKSGECRDVAFNAPSPIVGELQNGQIYALPLGERILRPHLPLGLSSPHLMASEVVNTNNPHELMPSKLNTHHATIGFHQNRHDSSSDDVDSGDKQHVYIKHGCTPSSPLYPGCLIGASFIMGNLLDDDGNVDMAAVFESSDLDYDLYLDMLGGNNSRKKNTVFQQFLKIMSSWIAPTVALLFVVSFEMGRRERLKREAKHFSSSIDTSRGSTSTEESKKAQNSSKSGGVIQLSEEILGFGGHGTIVYKGVLDKRQVAVKRLLNMYHASADREIELLIESDGHPNVVRYFLKEMRGDFVYLALELCDMSLNDLIVSLSKLRNTRKENLQYTVGNADDFESATKSLLFQIASGVKHIHSLRIVHRDLKPQNILVALRSKSKPVMKLGEHGGSDSDTEVDDTTHTTCSDTNSILECFKNQEYVPKISDMGLGKQLAGQSSFGLSTLGTNSVGGGLAGDAGAGAGSVGWQAPEVMAQRFMSPEASSNAEASELSFEASPLDAGVNRTSRSVDIFSLGCIFYCTILPGSHPFGEWYEREANIMKNSPNREELEFVSPDACDLILSMIHRNARARPTADEVCEHPFFWSLSKRLKFLCDVSDRIESCDMSQEKDSTSPASIIFAIEKGAVDVFGTSWEKIVDHELIQASISRRTYDPSSVRDLLRMIRNKHHHYEELPTDLKSKIGSSTDGLSNYVMRTFPRLLRHCYRFCVSNLGPEDSLVIDYKMPIPGKLSLKSIKSDRKKAVITDLSALEEKMETIPDDDDVDQEDDVEKDYDSDQDYDVQQDCVDAQDDDDQKGALNILLDEESAVSDSIVEDDPDGPPSTEAEFVSLPRTGELDINLLSGIIVWSGSNAAKDLNCRGWYRSDNEWTQRLDVKLRKRDTDLARCAEDPKFRTRLCNHFDVSLGMHCPMRKKRCIFAHGPVELRVKEGKRHRWGTLVNKHGLSANPKASGGEDTYGAARTIENTRKDQGQWTVDSTQKKPQAKGKPKVMGKQKPKKN